MRSRNGPEIGTFRELIVVCAANRYDGIKLADQHMAERLARFNPVLYVDPPISRLNAFRDPSFAKLLKGPRLQAIGPNLLRYIPVVLPFPGRRGMVATTTTILRYLLQRVSRKLGGNVLAVVSAWPQFQIFGSCHEQMRLYWAQDDFVAGAALFGLNSSAICAGETRVASSADFIVASNPTVADKWRNCGYRVNLVPFGADTETFEGIEKVEPAADVHLVRPIAGLIGQLNDRVDVSLLEAVADRGRSVLIVGPWKGGDMPTQWAALLRRSNVQWVGSKALTELPRYLRAMSVGLVPYTHSAFNLGSFPLKTLEYLAAGLPVVSTGLPATRWLNTKHIGIADGTTAFADAVDYWLNQEVTAEVVGPRREFAKLHSWEARAKSLVDLIRAYCPAVGPKKSEYIKQGLAG